MIFLFPASPVVERFKPQLGAVAVEGVRGSLFNGKIDQLRSTDDLLPLEASNVSWRLAPGALLKGGAGATIGFDALGTSRSVILNSTYKPKNWKPCCLFPLLNSVERCRDLLIL